MLLAQAYDDDEFSSDLSGFDEDMITTEEMNEILESRNRSLIEHNKELALEKLTKWRKEMNRQHFNQQQRGQTLATGGE